MEMSDKLNHLVVKFIRHVCVLVALALHMLDNGVFQINLLSFHA